MGKVRVFELARELNMQSKDLVNLLNELGVKAKNHMSSIDENAARYVMRKYGPDAEGAKPGVEQEDRKVAGPAQPAQAQKAAPSRKRAAVSPEGP